MTGFPFRPIAAIALIGLWLSSASAQSSRPGLIASWTEAEPYYRLSETGEIQGFVPDLTRALARDAGFTVTFVRKRDLEQIADDQANGATDILVGVPASPALRSGNVLSDPVGTSRIGLISLLDRADQIDPATAAELRIGVLRDDFDGESRNFIRRNDAVLFGSASEAVLELLANGVDALLADDATIFGVARAAQVDHRIALAGEPLQLVDRVVVLAEEHRELLTPINTAIARFTADGRLERMRQRYLIDLPPPPPETLTVGIAHLPPFTILDDRGVPSGFAVEALKDLAERAGLDLEFRAISASEWLEGPGPARYDILPFVDINDERRTRMEFTLPVQLTNYGVFVRTGDEGVRVLGDLSGRRVGVLSNTQSELDAVQAGLAALVGLDTPDQLANALVAEEIDAVFSERDEMRAALIRNRAQDEVSEIALSSLEQEAIALRKGLGEIRERLNAVIPAYLISNEFAALRSEWLGADVFWTRPRLQAALAAGVFLILAMAAWQLLSMRRARSSAKNLAGEQKVSADIAALKNRLESVLNTAYSGIFALDEHGSVVMANPRARHMLGGISAAPPFAWPDAIRFLDVETHAPLDKDHDPIQRVLNNRLVRGETHLMTRAQAAAERRYVRFDSATVDSADDTIKAVVVLEDVSEQERNRQVVERKSRLDALGQLTGDIAHDFNNLLASLLYAVDLAQRQDDAEKRNALLDAAKQAIDGGRELTSRLLSFAKRQPGRASARDTNGVFQEFERLIRPMIEAQFTLTFECDEDRLLVFCDQTQLETALMNLVLNSRDAMLRSGCGNKITIGARSVASATPELEPDITATEAEKREPVDASLRFVEVSVSDNGPGMDESTLSRATDPFFTTKDTNSGTGLGLAMVYGFVQQSEGALRIYSEPGTGTTVRLTLPRGTEAGLREGPVPRIAPPRGNGETVLLVDDEPRLLNFMAGMLEELGYTVEPARSGSEALAIIESDLSIDVLLTDVVMPGKIGGFDLASRFRERQLDIPVIYMSGYTGFDPSEMGPVAAPILQKPCPPDELSRILADVLGNVPLRSEGMDRPDASAAAN